jgi:diguanylate cyclase (GGDEF)-like protein
MVKYPYSEDVKAFVVFTDIDRQRRELERLARLASCDALTGLLNRDVTEKRISDILRAAGGEDTFALYMIDLDNFKGINDTLGHRQGDRALKTAANAISDVFRASDVVGRVGGDEFMVFLTGGATPRLTEKKASALCSSLRFTVGCRDCDMELSASVGAVYCRDAKVGFAALYQMADAALYRAKKAGKNRYCIDWAGTCPEANEGSDEMPVSGAVQLQAILEYMDGGMELLELSDPVRQIYVSPSFCRMMGVERAEYALPRPLAEVMVHPDDVGGYEAALREGAARGAVVDRVFRQSGTAGSGTGATSARS